MTQELLFTSAERGLDLGRSGFCTVKRTRGMSKRLERLLHELSVYRALYPPHDARFAENPIVFMHCRASVDGQMVSILSRVCAAPPDYSGRSNYFAHHVVLSASELPQAGPAWLLKQQNFFESRWDGQVAELPTGRVVPRGEQEPRRCTTWELVTGDAGWAGVALRYLTENPTMPFYIIVEEKTPVLELLDELVALLPPDKRWSATFTTRYLHLPSGVTCAARFVPLGNEKISEAKASSRYLDLTALRGKHPPDDPYSEAARTGQHVQIPQQFLRAEDEPVLPVNLQAFSQVQVAGPIRHNPGLSVPQVPVTPAPPPPVAANPPTSRMPLWLVLFTLFHFVLTGGLAAFLYLAHRAQHELKEEFKQELAQQSSDIKSLRESASKNLQEETAKLQSSVEQTRKAVVVELEAQLKALRKELANARSEFEKRTAEIENNLLQERQEIKKLVSLLANREQEIEALKRQVEERFSHLREVTTVELAVREKKPRVVQGKALNLEGQLPENFANVLTRSTVVQRIVWNDRVYPLREVKDAKTGRILSASIENNTLTILFGDKMQPETIVRLSTPVFSDPAVAKAPERMRELAENLSNLDLIIIGLDHKVWKVKLNVKEPIGLQVDPPILNHQSPK